MDSAFKNQMLTALKKLLGDNTNAPENLDTFFKLATEYITLLNNINNALNNINNNLTTLNDNFDKEIHDKIIDISDNQWESKEFLRLLYDIMSNVYGVSGNIRHIRVWNEN